MNVSGIEESSTYQLIINRGLVRGREEGREEGREVGREEGVVSEARRLVLRLGTKRLGTPNQATVEAIMAITSLETLELLAERLLEAETWAELMAVGE